MRRHIRIVSSAAAAGAVLAGAAVTIAATPHHPTAAKPSGRQPLPRAASVDPTLATLGAQSRAEQRRIAELNRAIAGAEAKIRAEAMRRAAAARLQQRQEQAAQAAAATGQNRSGPANSAPTVNVATLPPIVHTTTGASGSIGSSKSDEPGGNEPGSDDGADRG